MYTPRKTSISSALGALMASALLTVVTVLPDAVHAKTAHQNCVKTFSPSIQ